MIDSGDRTSEAGLPWIPELSGDYDLIRELGRGGTAVVYLARERELGRDVAIKLIRPAYVRDEDAIARLVREARTVGKLQHPSIVMLLGTRRLGDRGLALILQYVPGSTLKDRIRERGPLPFDQVERILRDLGQALAYAHTHRIVHRDIKPENVYLDEGSGIAKLADFGLARGWDSDSGLTMPGTAIGTPTYMSPEQIEGRDLDGRSDLYSLGLVGYEALTGRQPWAGESLYAIIYKQKHEDPPPILGIRPDTPPTLVAAIEGSIRKNPNERWRSAHEFLNGLRGAATPPPRAVEPKAPVRALPVPDAPTSAESGPARGAAAGLAASSVAAAVPPSAPATQPAIGTPPSAPNPRVGQTERRLPAPAPPRKRSRGKRRWIALGVVAVAALLLVAQLAPESRVAEILNGLTSFAESGGGPLGGGDPTGPAASTPTGAPAAGVAGGPDIGIQTTTGEFLTPAGAGPVGPPGRTPTGITVLGGNDQLGVYGAPLSLPLSVRLVDAEGIGVGGAPVLLEVIAGGGSLDRAQGITAPDGSLQFAWTLGPDSPEQVVRARTATEPALEAVFSAEARPPSAARVEVVQGLTQEGSPGQPLPLPLEIRVIDPAGNPFPGALVRFTVRSGGGTLDPQEGEAGAEGLVSARWTLGPEGGNQEAVVEVAGIPGVAATFRAAALVPRLTVTPAVSVGGTHSCTLRSDAGMVCWGANDRGQLGDGSRTSRILPTLAVQAEGLALATSGLTHVCALTIDGRALCWGANDQGQLGSPGPAQSAVPVPVAGSDRFIALAAGMAHTCALNAQGQAFCWGANENGQLGDATRDRRNSPTRVNSPTAFRQIIAGWRHSCALGADGTAYCWGENALGQLGSGGGTSTSPVPVQGGHRFQRLAAGNAHSCGITVDGTVLCWGANEGGQLGDDTTVSRGTPQPIQSNERFIAIAAGGLHSCGLTQDGGARCWGRNLYGQIGDGTLTDRPTPVAVSGNDRFSQIAAMGSHSCGRAPSGAVLCWGYNLDGQLGDGSRENRLRPTPVSSARP